MFPKYLLKISTNSLSSENNFIVFNKGNSFIFQSCICKRRFCGFPKKFIFGDVFYIELIVKLIFGFFNSFTQKFICLLYADLVASAFSFLYLFNNLERFIIVFCKIWFIKLAWLYLTYLSFKGAFFLVSF